MRALLILLAWCCPALSADWPGVPFSEVRAYYYNVTGIDSHPITKRGKLNPTVQNKEGALLTKEQVTRLLESLNKRRFRSFAPGCYRPRHGFVFYDETKKIVASYEVCFECGGNSSNPDFPGDSDLPFLADLVEELKLPMGPSERTAKTVRKEWTELRGPDPVPDYVEPEPHKNPEPVSDPELFPPAELTAAKVGNVEVSKTRFAAWKAKDPREYGGTYSKIFGKGNDPKTEQKFEFDVTEDEGKFFVNGMRDIGQEYYLIWEEPFLMEPTPHFRDRGCQPFMFATYRGKDGKVVRGFVRDGHFYLRKEAKKATEERR